MSEEIPGALWIGGKIPQGLMRELAQIIDDSGAEYSVGADFKERPETLWGPDVDLLDYLDDEGHLGIEDGDARYGHFEELENWLRKHGIPFNLHSDAKYEYDAYYLYWRPEMGADNEGQTWSSNQSGDVLVQHDSLRVIFDMMKTGQVSEAMTHLEKLITIPVLPRLEFVADPPPKVKKLRKKKHR